jgi:hypothetical protein
MFKKCLSILLLVFLIGGLGSASSVNPDLLKLYTDGNIGTYFTTSVFSPDSSSNSDFDFSFTTQNGKSHVHDLAKDFKWHNLIIKIKFNAGAIDHRDYSLSFILYEGEQINLYMERAGLDPYKTTVNYNIYGINNEVIHTGKLTKDRDKVDDL